MQEEQGRGQVARTSSPILDTLVQVVHKAAFIDNQPVDFGNGAPLSAAEIHLIDMAGRFPSDNISELACRLGVTKGAVSQLVQKLERKGYLTRRKEEGNRKNVSLELTDNGITAFDWHHSLHQFIDAHILSTLAEMEEEDQQRLLDLLTRLSHTLDLSYELRAVHLRQFLKTHSR